MAYYDALISKWATLTGTTAQKLAAVNALTAPGPNQDVSASSVIGYLALNAKLAGLQTYAASTNLSPAVIVARELMACLNMPAFTTFQFSNPTVASTLTAFLNELAQDANSGITTADVNAILSLGATTISWCAANGYPAAPPLGTGITTTDLANAGGLT